MRGITMDQSLSIILNTFKKAEEMEAYALAAIVLDAGGRVKAFLKQDGASLMVLQKSREKPPFMDTLRDLADGPIFLEAGGQLIRDEFGEVIGAIGVTGDVNEVDDICAIAGIRATGLKSDEDFSETEAKRLNIKTGPKLVDPRQR